MEATQFEAIWMLPPCFVPTPEVGTLLARVHEGYNVRWEDAAPLHKAGLIYIVQVPTSRSGYELTEHGEVALGRYVYSNLAGGSRA